MPRLVWLLSPPWSLGCRKMGPEGGWQLALPCPEGKVLRPLPIPRHLSWTDTVAKGQTRTKGAKCFFSFKENTRSTKIQFHKQSYSHHFSFFPLSQIKNITIKVPLVLCPQPVSLPPLYTSLLLPFRMSFPLICGIYCPTSCFLKSRVFALYANNHSFESSDSLMMTCSTIQTLSDSSIQVTSSYSLALALSPRTSLGHLLVCPHRFS